jgi:putative hydrolase of the HAD superfamily
MVLVSNYYGNIENVLIEFNIRRFFEGVVDSGSVGIRKPDPAIWMMGVRILGLEPNECLVVGDSYTRDIVPAKKIGCYTAWIDGKSYSVPEQTSDADFIIKSNYSLKTVLL